MRVVEFIVRLMRTITATPTPAQFAAGGPDVSCATFDTFEEPAHSGPCAEQITAMRAELRRYEALARTAATDWQREQFESFADNIENEMLDLEEQARSTALIDAA